MTRDEIKEVFGEVLFDVSIELGRKKVSVGEMLRYETGTIIRHAKTQENQWIFLLISNL